MTWQILRIFLIFLIAPPMIRAAGTVDRPNVVLIFVDDLGYGDLGCYGGRTATPNIDRMAQQGVRFTDFYVPQAVCTASRAALLSGCYPNRLGLLGALNPNSTTGINSDETIMPEVFKSRGYATAIYGKWHLGHQEKFLPTNHGFDEYYGLPYSNDMWPKHPSKKFPDLPLIEGTKTIELDPDQSKLTTSYTERAVDFIRRKKAEPFFLYVPHTMPHVPLFISEKFAGKSGDTLYADVVMEIDWSVGQILDEIKANGLDERTLVIFTSDNGPWLSYGPRGGSAGGLREGKGTEFEGGVREPCVMRWPGKIPAGTTCREPAMTIDLLPTFAELIGAELPTDRIIDGKNIWPLIASEQGARSPHEAYFFYWNRELHAVRSGKWKLHFPHGYNHPNPPISEGVPSKMDRRTIELSLFDLETDTGETNNVAAEHPDVVERLQSLAERARDDLGDALTDRVGKNVREPGKIDAPASNPN